MAGLGPHNDLTRTDLTQLDYAYVASWSLWWDLKIMWETPKTMARGTGAYYRSLQFTRPSSLARNPRALPCRRPDSFVLPRVHQEFPCEQDIGQEARSKALRP